MEILAERDEGIMVLGSPMGSEDYRGKRLREGLRMWRS